jgi:hypothetical protein
LETEPVASKEDKATYFEEKREKKNNVKEIK